MSKVKSTHTRPEMIVRKYLHKYGFRFSLHKKNLPGTPDIVLKKYKTIIFVNGCFWHGHDNCSKAALPKTRTEYWKDKIACNKDRDIINYQKLIDLGWKVLIIFQCELKNKFRIEDTLSKIVACIKENNP